MPANPPSFPDPIEIEIPPGSSDDLAIAYLLATIGHPPASPEDRGWRETVLAYRRASLEYDVQAPAPTSRGTPSTLMITPEELMISDQLRVSRLHHARQHVERAMFAAAVAAPEVIVALQKAMGEPLEDLPRDARHPASREVRISRLLQAEDDAVEMRGSLGIQTAPTRLRAMGLASQMSVKNVQTRVLQPAEPVLHLALSLKYGLDTIEGELAKSFANRSAWEKEGFGTTVIRQSGGDVLLRPRITERHLFLLAGIFAETIERAELMFGLLAEEYIAAGRRSSFAPMIKLTRG